MDATEGQHRQDPPESGNEKSQLLGFLGYHRDTLRMKVDGLSGEQLNAVHQPSTMTLGGMLKHLALVEQWWFGCTFLGREYSEPWASVDWEADEDWDWHSAAADTPEQLRTLFDAEVADSDAIIAAAPGLDALSVREGRRTGKPFNLRWILLHMIEEYARHNGHADLIRESIDGVTGE
jgi:uncharacterized damage-inducible protein DinB